MYFVQGITYVQEKAHTVSSQPPAEAQEPLLRQAWGGILVHREAQLCAHRTQKRGRTRIRLYHINHVQLIGMQRNLPCEVLLPVGVTPHRPQLAGVHFTSRQV